jgi:hypothetical protein
VGCRSEGVFCALGFLVISIHGVSTKPMGEESEDGDPSHGRRSVATVPSSHLALAGQISYRRAVPSVGVPSDLLLRNKVKSSGCTQREWTK